MTSRISQWLDRTSSFWFGVYAITAAFSTYFCMYAFRKPFAVGEYAGLSLFGIDYKIVLLVTQVAGYTLSKFTGIKVVSEMTPGRRIGAILLLIGVAEVSLLLFGLVPPPWNFVCLFFNGLPLGMVWGLVFSFLEGRRTTELLGAGLCTSFIVASGAVKSVGSFLMVEAEVSQFWMPALCGLIFTPPLLLSTWLLSRIPPPDAGDVARRTERVPLDAESRHRFFREFAPGIVVLVVIYVALNAYRDFRDNFAPELWRALGYGDEPAIFTQSEIPIAVSVVVVIGLMMFIRRNVVAFWANHAIVLAGGLLVAGATVAYDASVLSGAPWMILVGLGMYVAYIAYHTMLWERLIATFERRANVGYLMYLCDAFGYLGSVAVMLYKNFGAKDLSWLEFFRASSYVMAAIAVGGTLVSIVYFRRRFRSLARPT